LSVYFIIRHGKRLGETLKLPRLSRVSGALRPRPASRKLQRLVSDKILNVSVSAQKVSCTSMYAASFGLSPAISTKFTFKMSVAARNRKKIHAKPFSESSRPFKVISVDKTK